MKNGLKLFAAGAAIAAVAGLLAYKKYQDSYEQVSDEDMVDLEAVTVEDDFVPMEVIDDGFDYVMEDVEQIMFHE